MFTIKKSINVEIELIGRVSTINKKSTIQGKKMPRSRASDSIGDRNCISCENSRSLRPTFVDRLKIAEFTRRLCTHPGGMRHFGTIIFKYK